MLRRPRRAPLGVAGHLDGEHVVVAEAGERRDVEAVGEEVALGIAEVGAVEPHVGLVEDAVERDPAPPARRRRRAARSGAGRGSGRRCRRARGATASGRARRRSSQSSSSTSRPIPSRRSSSSAALARHAPDRSTAAQATGDRDVLRVRRSGSTLDGWCDPADERRGRRRSTASVARGSPSTAPTRSPSIRSGRRTSRDPGRPPAVVVSSSPSPRGWCCCWSWSSPGVPAATIRRASGARTSQTSDPERSTTTTEATERTDPEPDTDRSGAVSGDDLRSPGEAAIEFDDEATTDTTFDELDDFDEFDDDFTVDDFDLDEYEDEFDDFTDEDDDFSSSGGGRYLPRRVPYVPSTRRPLSTVPPWYRPPTTPATTTRRTPNRRTRRPPPRRPSRPRRRAARLRVRRVPRRPRARHLPARRARHRRCRYRGHRWSARAAVCGCRRREQAGCQRTERRVRSSRRLTAGPWTRLPGDSG